MAPSSARLAHHRLDRGGIGDVGQHGTAHASLAALLRDGVQLSAIGARIQHEVGALGGERQGDGAPDIAAGAGDQRGPAVAWLARGPCASS